MKRSAPISLTAAVVLMLPVLAACAGQIGQPTTRLGMVKEPSSGLMFGSVVEKNFVTDASFYKNSRIKVRSRNTSGDTAFDIHGLADRLRTAYSTAGYEPTLADDFGVLVDVNVRYSGQVQTNLANEFAFLGATAGGITGASTHGTTGAVAGVAAGATLGAIVGSFVTDDTYIVIADVTFGIIKNAPKTPEKTVTFSRSWNPQDDDEDEQERKKARGFRQTYRTQVAVFAGGRNVTQAEIAQQVRERLARIVSQII